MPHREKRSAQVRANIPATLKEQLELFVAEEGKVISMSDYLFGVLEEHVEMKTAMRIAKQKLGRRVGNQ
jgi:hypothetical protein